MAPESAALRLMVDPLDLGPDVRAIGLELAEEDVEVPAESPARGADAVVVWAAALRALAGGELWALDFTSHLDRLRDFCQAHEIEFRQAAPRCIVIPQPMPEKLLALIGRFEAETFGFRAGPAVAQGDTELENNLSRCGMDTYHHAYQRFSLCGICDFENGSLTILSEKLSSAEILRRLRPALAPLGARVERPE